VRRNWESADLHCVDIFFCAFFVFLLSLLLPIHLSSFATLEIVNISAAAAAAAAVPAAAKTTSLVAALLKT
jgi:hypothetical protein